MNGYQVINYILGKSDLLSSKWIEKFVVVVCCFNLRKMKNKISFSP